MTKHLVAFLIGSVLMLPIVLGILFYPEVLGVALFILILVICAWGIGWCASEIWLGRKR
jgi:hypothetical protein